MLKICFVVLLNLTIFCMELTCVYIESVGESYEKQKGESLMIFDKSKQGLMLKQRKQGGSIYFVNSRLQELVEKCQIKQQEMSIETHMQNFMELACLERMDAD